MNNQCYWPLTRCPNCNEQYCEKCETHTCRQKTNRQLFVSLMRKPEMSLLRQALLHLKYDKDMDWRDIMEIDVSCDPLTPIGSIWMIMTDRFQIYTIWAGHPDMGYDRFHFMWLHNPNTANCPCEDCRAHPLLNS